MFKLFGFAVRVDPSWLLILALVVWSLAGGVFRAAHPQLGWPGWLALGLAGAGGLFLSIVIHEMMHSLVARRFGLPMKGITLFLFGGVAEMSDEPPNPKTEFWMAIAGPAISVVLGVVLILAASLATRADLDGPGLTLLGWLGNINILLAIFNMVPAFPLDGGRVLRSILWHFGHNLRRATRTAARAGAIFGLVLTGLGFLSLLAGNLLGGMWFILIGLFVRKVAKNSYQQVLVRQFLRGEPVSRFMSSQPLTVPHDLPVDRLVEDYVYRHHYKLYPVMQGDQLVGCVTTRDIQQVPREQWPVRRVAEISHSCAPDNAIDLHQDAFEALSLMSRRGISRAVVVDDGRLAGVISLKDLSRFLSLKLELEDNHAQARRPRQE